MPQTIDFGFINRDIARQRELAQKALDEAKRIDELLKNPALSPEDKVELEDAKRKWLAMAKGLAENAITTSTTANTTISTVILGR